ncbi:ABC transporter ATP-binding protein [candidate division CSSED10-310 bacterium]|uniref:ABC transporter ATP-binding protein n=1 Tax=candidate division CSSED10-310 bacterium TaxID=2855610 RepID=A0ABV6YXK9_UNCC1
MIEVFDLIKRFGALTAVNNISLKISAREWYLFVGPNGAGKTTTFRMLAGLIPPTQGKIRIKGRDVYQNSRYIKGIVGYLPEKPFLYSYLSGIEYLEFAADMHSITGKLKHSRIQEILELVNFEQEAQDLISTYSSGMKKKLGLCAVLVHDPPILLLDEPTSDLDPRTSNLVRRLLQELTRLGKTVFMSTHIFGITEHLCHRVGILDRGRLIYEGTIESLQHQFPNMSFEEVFLELTGRYDESILSDFLDGASD